MLNLPFSLLGTATMNPSDTEVEVQVCPICKKELEDGDDRQTSQLFKKGADTINDSSRKRGREDIVAKPGQRVHKQCRNIWTNEKDIKRVINQGQGTGSPIKRKSLRVSMGSCNNKTNCFFCGQHIAKGSHGHDEPASQVLTKSFPEAVLAHCEERSDDWAFTVKGRIIYFGNDLRAPDCVYHKQCSINFRTGRDIPEQFRTGPVTKRKRPGRPKNGDQEQAFLKMCEYLQRNDEEQMTVSDLVSIMSDHLSEEESVPYGNQYMKEKLKGHFGDSIHISEGEGLHDLITMTENTSKILRDYFKSMQSGDEESQKHAIINTAAKLLKSDIKTYIPSVTDQYPPSQTLRLGSALDYLPKSLHSMLNIMFVGTDKNEKVASIGHSIIQATRPRAVIAPLQIGLASQLHFLYKSRFLVDTLSTMGFCSSYGELKRFQMNAAGVVAPDILGDNVPDMVVFAADNVDHNILTIDGRGSFHGMGMIAATTPATQCTYVIPRKNVSLLNVKEMTQIDIIDYRFSTYARRHVMFESLPQIDCLAPPVDILWETSFCFHQEIPNWQGMMHILHSGRKHPGKASIKFLPILDMYPGDPTCILSTLTYICALAEKSNISPVITFDQPLFWKASEIIYNAPKDSPIKTTVLMLGTFHTLMNVLGAIGTLMQGTGLTYILEEIYGENAVKHIMSGKSVQRAFRGHLLVEKSLNGLLVSKVIDCDPEFAAVVHACEQTYNSLLAGDNSVDSILSEHTNMAKTKLEELKSDLMKQSRTSKLWLSYQNMVEVARRLVMADRIGSWSTHLWAMAQCLPICAAAGHFHYVKSAYLYLQNMKDLETRNPVVFKKFQDGFHVIRRTDQFWAGLSADLVIEQTLMRSLKSIGGLTRGSHMTEEQRALWTLSSPVCSEYNSALQDFNHRVLTTSEQHKEGAVARIKRDQSDLTKIKVKLESCNPFSTGDPSLHNIITGVVASDECDVDDYSTVGNNIIEKLVGQPVFTYSFKRKDKAITLSHASAVKVTPQKIIDPALLFQRLIVISKAGELSLQDTLEYELSPFPPALFEASYMFRKADKPQLIRAIENYAAGHFDKAVSNEIPLTDNYILDGGSLLHRVPWTKGSMYGTIADLYVEFTLRNYGTATVVFDGYQDTPSTKDSTHQRRQQKNHPLVSVTPGAVLNCKKDDFLSTSSNKQALIDLISKRLRGKGCTVVNCTGDADTEIVSVTIAASEYGSTTLIGEDTDLLVLLLYHMKPGQKSVFFRSDKKTTSQVRVYNINKLKILLGPDLCSHLLFIHAFTGCDTTSRVFGVGKKAFFQKFIKGNKDLESCAICFTNPGQTCDTVEDCGYKAMVQLFGGKPTDSLTTLRYNVLKKKVISGTSFVTPEKLPPTASATKFHSRRCYYQIMTWLGKETGLDATEWGWKFENNQFQPVMSDKSPAPDNLLKVVHCSCTTACTSGRCTCRGYGLPCTSTCGQCQTESCENPFNQPRNIDSDLDDSDA